MIPSTILWRRLDRPGHEAARLIHQPSDWHLTGTAVFTHDHHAVFVCPAVRIYRRTVS